MSRRDERLGALYVILSAVLFGTMPLVTKIAYQHASNAYTVVFGRYAFGALIAAAAIAARPGLSFRITSQQLWQLLLLSVFNVLTPLLLYLSYNTVDSGLATTLHFTYPVMVILLLRLCFHERLTGRKLLCTALCVAGVLLLYAPEGRSDFVGVILAVLSGVTFSIFVVGLGRSALGPLSVLVTTFWLSLFASMEIGLGAALTGNLLLISQGWQAWAVELELGLMTTVLALALFQKGVFLCGEVSASLLSNFEPITGIAIGVLVFGEVLTPRTAAGVLCILVAATMTALTKRQHGHEA